MIRFYSVALALLLVWLPASIFAQTISSLSPASGNAGTLVTLTGTSLNLVTAVAVNGTAGVILNKTGTSLRLLVMPGTTSGTITVTGPATATSSATFTLTRTALTTTQQGPKLVGTGAVGTGAAQGQSVALSADGNTLAVGASADNANAGATWIFTRTGTAWSQQGAKLVGIGAIGTGAAQGQSVALSADGNTLAVGASADNANAGATWIFTRTGTAWSQQGAKLVGTGAVGTAAFQGFSVALSADGNTLAMGAPGDINLTGATWIFTRLGTAWSQQGPKLVGIGTNGAISQQGFSVALSADGNTLAAGAPSDALDTGATWVFTRTGMTWSQQGAKLVGTGASGLYGAAQGNSVALSADGNTLAAGGPSDNRFDGATWVFARTGTAWSQQGSKLSGTGTLGNATFQGSSVALSADGNTLAAGDPANDTNLGATWVFTRTGTVWSQPNPKLVGTGAILGPVQQGHAVALSADGSTLATGGLKDNNNLGATWVFSTASSLLAQRAAIGPQVSANFFPNPIAEQLTVIGGAHTGTLRLFDGTGRTLFIGAYQNGQPLDFSFLPAGLYWLALDQAPARPILKR
ncbi:MAG: hypothetical protein EOO60_02665 [Hymenobacter sp.]|nr:MAG: hypothetical protein EOO60_02665 [Hymenobacter sp.]